MKKNLLFVIQSVTVLVLVLLDQITKIIARNYIKGNAIKLIPGVFSFTYVENRGSVWGIMQGRINFLLIVTLILFSALLYCYVKIPKTGEYLPLLWLDTFMMAGALGNAIDRVFFGYVTDFIYIELINFPVFNVADCYITCTAVITIILILTRYKDDNFTFLRFKEKKSDGKGTEN